MIYLKQIRNKFIVFIRHWWKDNNFVIAIAFFFFLLGLLGSIPGTLYNYVPVWVNNFHVNLSPEMLSISFTILFIDSYNYLKTFRSNRKVIHLIEPCCLSLQISLFTFIAMYYLPNASRKSDEEIYNLFINKINSFEAVLDANHDKKIFLIEFINLLNDFENELNSMISLSFDINLTEEIFRYRSTVKQCRDNFKNTLKYNHDIDYLYYHRLLFSDIFTLHKNIMQIKNSFQR